MTEAEAYRQWRANEMARQRYLRTLRQAGELIKDVSARIAADMAAARERRICELTDKLGRDQAFIKVLKAYNGHTPHGWVVACGCDGRMKALIRLHGWDVIKEVIRKVRYSRMFYKHIRPDEAANSRRVTLGDVIRQQ